MLGRHWVGGYWYLQCSSVGVGMWEWVCVILEILFLLSSHLQSTFISQRGHPRRSEADTAVSLLYPVYASFLHIISIIVTLVCVCSWIFKLELMFLGQFCINMPLQTTARGHQLEVTPVMTFLKTEVITWVFLGVCIMLVCDLLRDQSLIKSGETYYDKHWLLNHKGYKIKYHKSYYTDIWCVSYSLCYSLKRHTVTPERQ